MIINSISFLLFFTLFFVLYWSVFNKTIKQQNLLLLIGSYFFYCWADWRFLALLISASALNFILGLQIEKTNNGKKRKLFVYIGIIQGIGVLAFFKYYNFFILSFNDLFHSLNVSFNLQTLSIIVPLGISFFTFRTISYILDVDKGKVKPTEDWVVFFNYVAFFPSLLSGPIDKAKGFIIQLETKRLFNYTNAMCGLRQILWGLFKKVVIADNCALITDAVFENFNSFSGSSLLLAAFLYAVQIYADFSGYSDMAIGISKLIGFNISKNFNYPFFAQNIAEFWRRWHMSLTSWLTEYVFTPLSTRFRDYYKWGVILAIIINFTICGIWHGANWTYVLFGFLHGCYFIPLIIKGVMNKKSKINSDSLFPSLRETMNILKTFIIVMFTFIIFRSDTITETFEFYKIIFSKSLFSLPSMPLGMYNVFIILLYIIIMFGLEWKERNQNFALETLSINWGKKKRLIFYYLIILSVVYFSGSEQKFIYLQF